MSSIPTESRQMRAAVIYEAGGPEVFHIKNMAIPKPKLGFVRIRVKAFGLNRSEVNSRQSYAPSHPHGWVMGVEAVGVVEYAPGSEFKPGEIVATALGVLGRELHGSYAECVCVPVTQVQVLLSVPISWATFGAMPQTFQAAWGSLFRALFVKKNERLLIRGGTTTVGLAAAAMANLHGVRVTSTTRNVEHMPILAKAGAADAILDRGDISPLVIRKYDKVLDLVGTTTLADSLLCAQPGGVVCLAGMVGGGYAIDHFIPLVSIPNGVSLTSYCGDVIDWMNTPIARLAGAIESKKLFLPFARSFDFENIAAAHRYVEENHGMGKVVITVDKTIETASPLVLPHLSSAFYSMFDHAEEVARATAKSLPSAAY
jgi:NADPH:quinone reductase-like Zn-dependent oxidoreductase